jgi:prepilin-type processing-associated H-X9-DG protein
MPPVAALPAGLYVPWQGCNNYYAMIQSSFPDGLGNTILYVDKYTYCTSSESKVGGQEQNCDNPQCGGQNWSDPELDYFTPTFGWFAQGPLANMFQIMPNYTAACDPMRSSSGHTGGINVSMGDGSVRLIARGISPNTWFMALIPNDGNPLGSDW